MGSTLSRIKTFYCVIFFLANNTSQTKHKLMHNAKFLRKIRYFVTTSFKSRFMFFVLRKLLGPKTVAPIFSRQIQYLALARNVPLAFRKYHEISKNLLLDCLIFASGRDTQQNNLSHLTQYLHTLRKTGTKVYAICVNLTNTYTCCVKVAQIFTQICVNFTNTYTGTNFYAICVNLTNAYALCVK